jgi:hypothetical protein
MTPKEQEIILSEFPTIKLSYETKVHKKVYNAHMCIAIPEGIRHFAWFTTFKNENVCWLLELSNTNQIINVKSCITGFSDVLSYGTVLYGTLFKHSTNNMCFSVEDMFFYKGNNLQNHNFLQKLELIQQMFSLEMSMMAIHNKFVIFGCPYMETNFGKVLHAIPTLPYKSSIIQFRYLEGTNSNQYYNMNYIKPRTTNQLIPSQQLQRPNKPVFKITPDIQNDIYKLHTLENGEYVFYDYAYIPSYVSSVMMNRLFRNIKENNNLDALEESDDESEFENNNLDKYVFLDKSFLMNCEFNHKFKKWFPVNIASDTAIAVSSKQLK